MKREFKKLFIIFGVFICIFALVGCDLVFMDNPDPEKNPAEESGSETSEISEESTIKSSEETLEDIFEPDGELIAKLIEYMRYIGTDFELNSISLAEQINRIKKGTQPLKVVFDLESDYYFVCAYFNTDHREIGRCCCTEEYIWVGFRNAEDIPEYYNGQKYLVAFQINEASFVSDIVSDEKKRSKNLEFSKIWSSF